ncbi:DNA-binding transcriptional ArsR family regulator [Pelomonas saccharophila]|uniref:DNA-binding transcriptional ArsR family regulator n=1 Tax=Roseateles saccharophilus TaxID=304 RepID=A0ABU1YVJ9_ROSSA|nr:metalloregulator ArsR/SmtB family transcription factor [Roseateles saccharophilus]MDR7272226.1 DNA-binding transcriptional ArsR family regulator [Roseateles saccharophilus]
MPSPPASSPTERLDRLFVALADGNRRAMVDQLSRGPASVTDLAKPLALRLPSAVKHLAVLEAGGLVQSDKAGRVRTYRIAPDAFGGLEAWVAERKATWHRQFDALEALLDEQDPQP